MILINFISILMKTTVLPGAINNHLSNMADSYFDVLVYQKNKMFQNKNTYCNLILMFRTNIGNNILKLLTSCTLMDYLILFDTLLCQAL